MSQVNPGLTQRMRENLENGGYEALAAQEHIDVEVGILKYMTFKENLFQMHIILALYIFYSLSLPFWPKFYGSLCLA